MHVMRRGFVSGVISAYACCAWLVQSLLYVWLVQLLLYAWLVHTLLSTAKSASQHRDFDTRSSHIIYGMQTVCTVDVHTHASCFLRNLEHHLV